MSPIFIDTNIFIYASGFSHQHKESSIRFLEKAAANQFKAISDTEVLQEILYYYWAKKDKIHGFRLVEKIIEIVPLILPVNKNDVLKAMEILDRYPQIEPRDAVHAGVMLNHGITAICTYDKHFDQILAIKKMEP